jgi:DNA-binding transcriptional ArsR family regulator
VSDAFGGFQGIGMSQQEFKDGLSVPQMELMIRQALMAADFLKAIAHEGRLLILCHLASGEKSVSDLENLLHYRQAAVSQQLARLRLEGLVKYRREGKVIYYSLVDEKSRKVIELVYDLFCDFAELPNKLASLPTGGQ